MIDGQGQSRGERWCEGLSRHQRRIAHPPPLIVEGKLTRMVGLTLEAVGCQVPVGGQCLVKGPGGTVVEAEVVGFAGQKTYLMPTGDIRGLTPNARVMPSGHVCEAVVGPGLLGRVVDGRGQPLDDGGRIAESRRIALTGRAINPMRRGRIEAPMDVGIRTINALLTVGRGQRMGLFAGSGVGKSVTLGMMTRFSSADVIVVGMIGERGREVKEFIDNILGEEGMRRAVVVATPANDPPLLRLHGAMLATSIAEYFRDEGKQVLLLMDSLTRFAQAQREIALAVGEPPATKGYPPSVFAKIPELVERTGNGDRNGGSITAFYTVLTEEDEQNDPIGDAAKAILDGHVVLSRELAEAGIYPAIDVEASISRALPQITEPGHQKAIQRFRQLYAKYRQNADLISVGAYHPGNDAALDEAVEYHPRLQQFLQQSMAQPINLEESIGALHALF